MKHSSNNPTLRSDRRTKTPNGRKKERRLNGRHSYKDIVMMCVFGSDGLLKRKLKKMELEEKKNEGEKMTKITTMQKTAKKWKVLLCLGYVFLAMGVLRMIADAGVQNSTESPGFLGVLFGLLLWVIGRLGKWWYHE